MTASQTLDSHLHLWDPEVLDYAWLSGRLDRRFGPDELSEATTPQGRQQYIFVQADCAAEQALAEVDWVLTLVNRVDVIGIVAFAPLERGSAVRTHLHALQSRNRVVGARRLLQSEQPGFALTPDFLAGARELAAVGLTFDAGVAPEQLGEVAELAERVPELTIILDHLGKPSAGVLADIVSRKSTSWEQDMRALALRPNVLCKLSGLPMEQIIERQEDLLVGVLNVALEAFGPDRILFGSDWPVSRSVSEWRTYVDRWAMRVGGESLRSAVMGDNARRAYRVV